MQLYDIKQKKGYARLAVSAALFLLLIVLAMQVFGGMEARVDAEQAVRLAETLRHATVTCFSVEGRYPPTLAYLTENYGVQVNQSKFTVDFQVIAPNIMPDIEVALANAASATATQEQEATDKALEQKEIHEKETVEEGEAG